MPSVIRVHKIATLEKDMILSKLGVIDNQTKESIRQVINGLIK